MQHCTYPFKVPSKGGARSSWGGLVAGAGTAVAMRGPGEGALHGPPTRRQGPEFTLRQEHSGGLSLTRLLHPHGQQRLGDPGPANQPAACPGPAQVLSLSPISSSIK